MNRILRYDETVWMCRLHCVFVFSIFEKDLLNMLQFKLVVCMG